jgi:hypothetical protein
MRDHHRERRQFLGILIAAPVAAALDYDLALAQLTESAHSPEASLRKLILHLGPWSAADRGEAEDFAERFLAARHAVAPYLPGSSRLVQSLAGRFPSDAVPLSEVKLRALPPEERELLLALAKQLYSFVEVRNVASHEPPIGECQLEGGAWHTRPPE